MTVCDEWQLMKRMNPKLSLASVNFPGMNDLPSHSGLFKIINIHMLIAYCHLCLLRLLYDNAFCSSCIMLCFWIIIEWTRINKNTTWCHALVVQHRSYIACHENRAMSASKLPSCPWEIHSCQWSLLPQKKTYNLVASISLHWKEG